MSFEFQSSEFALSASQKVSNSLKKVVTFKPVGVETVQFTDALAKFRENSFFAILNSSGKRVVVAVHIGRRTGKMWVVS